MGSMEVVRHNGAVKEEKRALTDVEKERRQFFKSLMAEVDVRKMFKWFLNNQRSIDTGESKINLM